MNRMKLKKKKRFEVYKIEIKSFFFNKDTILMNENQSVYRNGMYI